MDCEHCRHLTVVRLHDTGPRGVGPNGKGLATDAFRGVGPNSHLIYPVVWLTVGAPL